MFDECEICEYLPISAIDVVGICDDDDGQYSAVSFRMVI